MKPCMSEFGPSRHIGAPRDLGRLIEQLLAIEIIHCQKYTLKIIPPDERRAIRHRLPNGCGCLPKNSQAIVFGQCCSIVAFYAAFQKRRDDFISGGARGQRAEIGVAAGSSYRGTGQVRKAAHRPP
jgi:hypothetical protein